MTGTPNVTPNEIRNAKFATSLRGFKREDVEEFLNHASDALEDALSIAADYQQRYNHLQEKHEKLTSLERTLKSTLLEAKKTASSLIASAEADAVDILAKARNKQREIENKAQKRVNHMQGRIEELSEMRDDYQHSLIEVIGEHLKAIEKMHVEAPEIGNAENPHSDMAENETDGVVKNQSAETADIKNTTSAESQPALDSSGGNGEVHDDEITKTWQTIQETDTDGPAEAATLTEARGSADLFDESELDKYESIDETHTDSGALEKAVSPKESSEGRKESQPAATAAPDKKLKGQKKQETVADQIARAVRSAGTAPDTGEDSHKHETPAKTNSFMDEDTLYKKLAREHESEKTVSHEVSEKVTAKTDTKSNSKKSSSELPGPGPDGIMVFGRKEDRERSVEENVKVLKELDTVIDRFTEELEDIQRR